MDFADAQQMADEVLVQERSSPALHYSQRGPVLPYIGTPPATVPIRRSQFYFAIRERIEGLSLSSPHYDLLSIIYGQLTATDQGRFVSFLAQRLLRTDLFSGLTVHVLQAGKAESCHSESPLIAEFLSRQGQADTLIAQLRAMPYTPTLTLILLQLRTILAWDYRRFTNTQLNTLSSSASFIAEQVRSANQSDRNAYRSKAPSKQPVSSDPVVSNTRQHVLSEAPEVSDVLIELCREARFLYLRDSLTEGANLEVNQDKIRVADYLKRLGFPDDLAASLDEAENIYQDASTGFDYKSSMGHLRSFLENLHIEVCRKIHIRSGGVLPDRWGNTHEYLLSNSVLTKQEKNFVIPFFTLLSDEAVHPLQTTRDYARLLRNICIEYGLLLLNKVNAWVRQAEDAAPGNRRVSAVISEQASTNVRPSQTFVCGAIGAA